MTKLERFTKLKAERDGYAKEVWSIDLTHVIKNLRRFDCNRDRTRKYGPLPEDLNTVPELAHSEYSGASLVYHFSSAAGTAIRSIVLRRLDLALSRMAEEAKAEAQEVLKAIP